MKKLVAILAAAALVSMASSAMAAGSATLAVSASVVNACSVTGGTLSFGALDTLAAPQVTGTSSGVTVTCTKDAAINVGLNGGAYKVGTQSNLKNTSNADLIPYSLTVAALTPGTGAPQDVAITGTIAAGTYSTASAGTYNDTVTITVTP